jgi:hypothetical protein
VRNPFRRPKKLTTEELLTAIAAIGKPERDLEALVRVTDAACSSTYLRGWQDGHTGLPVDPFVGSEVRASIEQSTTA